LVWMYPGAALAYFIRKRLLHQDAQLPGARQIFVIGWTGMRGVLALAAALSLPVVLANGAPFPQRNLIVFLTFSVILVTLVLQGLTLPALIRALGLAGDAEHKCEEEEARRLMIEAALAHLEEARSKDGGQLAEAYTEIEQRYQHRLANLLGKDNEGVAVDPQLYARYLQLSRSLLGTERQTALMLRSTGRINDEVLRKIEHELDLTETRLSLIS
jgi:monovalent cation/hydrogen antiporter